MTIMACDERLFKEDEDRGATNRLLSVEDKNEKQLKEQEAQKSK